MLGLFSPDTVLVVCERNSHSLCPYKPGGKKKKNKIILFGVHTKKKMKRKASWKKKRRNVHERSVHVHSCGWAPSFQRMHTDRHRAPVFQCKTHNNTAHRVRQTLSKKNPPNPRPNWFSQTKDSHQVKKHVPQPRGSVAVLTWWVG
jgi:hypothetical protein